jgi:carbon monoxide dehydrogenase subunit G
METMEFTGRYSVPASPEIVWRDLNDIAILRACIPGCKSLERIDENHLEAVATLRVGPVKATFKAAIEQSERDPPRRCVLRGHGQGGIAGFARGEAEVLLARDGDGTALSYTARATIGGRLAQIAQRLIDGAARQIADDFFGRFAAQVTSAPEPPEPSAPPGREENLADTDPASAAVPAPRDGLAPEVWVVGLIVVVIILLALFGVTL